MIDPSAEQSGRTEVGLLRRLRPATWFVAALVGIALTLIVVPGELRSPPDGERLDWWERQSRDVYQEATAMLPSFADQLPADSSDKSGLAKFAAFALQPGLYEHGWPRPYLVRAQAFPVWGGYYRVRSEPWLVPGRRRETCNGALMEYVSWSNYDNWPLESLTWRIHPGNLAIDVTVAALAIGGAGFAVERRLRARGGLLRFRVIDLLVAFAVCGGALAWVRHHARTTELERQIAGELGQLENRRGQSLYKSSRRYVGPDWLRRLVGDDAYLPCFHHTWHARLGKSQTWEDDLEAIVRLPYLEKLEVNGRLPATAIDRLLQCDRLKTIYFDLFYTYNQTSVDGGASPAASVIGPENLDQPSVLRLRGLELRGAPFLAEDVERALSANALERLRLIFVSITDEEFEDLKTRFPDTEITRVTSDLHGHSRVDQVLQRKRTRQRKRQAHGRRREK